MVDTAPLEASGAWAELIDDKSATNWILAGIADDKKTAELVGKGTGGRRELIKHLVDDRVLFGAFRVAAIDERGSVTSKRTKFVFFTWLGPSVGVMAKARVNSQVGSFRSYFSGAHVDFQTDDVDDLSEEEIVKKLRASGGAHQPKRFEFGDSDDAAPAAAAAPAPEPVPDADAEAEAEAAAAAAASTAEEAQAAADEAQGEAEAAENAADAAGAEADAAE